MEEGQEGNNQAQSSSVAIPPAPSFFSLPLVSPSLCVSSGTSLPGYTGPQGDLVLDQVPQHRDLSSPPSPIPSSQLLLLLFFFSSCTPPPPLLPQHSPWGEDGEAIQS